MCSFFSFATIHMRPLPVNEKLSSNLVTTIFQDSDGYVYFGTASGLQRFDGYDVRTYINHPNDSTSLHDNYVQDIQRYPNGRLLIRAGETYCLYNQLTDKFQSRLDRDFAAMGIMKYPQIVTVDGEAIWFYVNGDGIYRHTPKEGLRKVSGIDTYVSQNEITDLIVLPDHREAYAVTNHGIILSINAGTMSLKNAVRVPDNSDSELVYTLFADRDKMIWTFAETGLFAFDPYAAKWIDNFAGTKWPMDKPRAITQDKDGRIWVGYNQGGLAVIGKNGSLEILRNVENDFRSLPANTVTSIFEDKAGTMWIGSLKKGLSVYNESMYKFDFHKFPDVNCILSAQDGNLWIGTDDKGLFLTDRNFNVIKSFGSGKASDPVVCLMQARDGTVYAGTYSGGLQIIKNGAVEHISCFDGLASGNVWGLLELDNGNILIATLGGGLQLMNPSDRSLKTFNPSNSGLASRYVGSLAKDADGKVYIGTAEGLSVFDPATEQITTLKGTKDNSKALTNLNINQVFVDSRGLVWIATRSGLNVYDPINDKLYEPDPDAEPVQKFILGITEDRNHTMWVSTGGTLSNISVDVSGNSPTFSFRNYNSNDGLQHCDFNQRSFCMLPDGEMLVGGLYGVNSFKPERILFNTFVPEVKLTGLRLFNQEVNIGEEYDGHVILPEKLNNIDEINLDYRQNEFTIGFATDDYILPEKITFSYILEGFNKEWTTLPESAHQVSYTNLSPGEYTLRVKATNNDGVSSAAEKTLKIKITPPFYASSWAKVIYALLTMALIVAGIFYIKYREKRKYTLQVEQENRQKQEELNQLKFKFFTNISHELRTPLTLITAPLEALIAKESDDNKKKKLSIMQANANRLLILVNQLLDFRKNEMTGLSLNPSQGNIVAFVRQICDSFLMFSEKKNIKFSFSSSSDEINMVFDEDKMGKIIMNLLSNAFKYTPENGNVDVAISQSQQQLAIKVTDTGRGISDEDKKHIFDRFFQASNSTNAIAGSGIGLSLVAEYVKLHDGSVAASDNPAGGTVFSVLLPIRLLDSKAEKQTAAKGETPAVDTTELTEHNDGETPKIMVVDDNHDLLEFITDELRSDYIVKTAENGRQALDKVSKCKPDLIISDIMMPEMDGIELCRILKSDPSTAAIPLMILTAKHDVAAKIEGLTLGADDYLTKPFNSDVLKLRIKKLLTLKEKGMKRTLIEPEPERIVITSLDEQLVEKAVKYVEKNIDRSELTVEEMSTELGMSRVHLYKRLKQLTGKTPIEFIRVIRLKRAAQLLRESQLNVSEIAYQCGFNNPKYFSKYFKDEFGMLPSVYQENNGI